MIRASGPITAEELLAMGDIGRCELIYGELVRRSFAGMQHGLVAGRISWRVSAHVEAHGLGQTFAPGTGFLVERAPDLVRAPDVSVVRAQRLPAKLPRGYFEGVPDLAVEVAEPADSRRAVAEKVNMSLAHGTTSCWVADAGTRTITIYRAGKKSTHLTTQDELRDEPTLPGFVMSVGRVFAGL